MADVPTRGQIETMRRGQLNASIAGVYGEFYGDDLGRRVESKATEAALAESEILKNSEAELFAAMVRGPAWQAFRTKAMMYIQRYGILSEKSLTHEAMIDARARTVAILDLLSIVDAEVKLFEKAIASAKQGEG